MAGDPAVATSNLVKHYGGTWAVDGVSLMVAQGEIFGLIGPNGAGKSTLIKMLTTLLPPSAGSAMVAWFRRAEAGGAGAPAQVTSRSCCPPTAH